jgi:hypothetical protein
LPRPFGAALPLAALAVLPLGCAAAGLLSWIAALGVAAGLVFIAFVRGSLAAEALQALRRTADGLLRTGVEPKPQSALLAWRTGEVTSTRNRKILVHSLQGIVRELEGRSLPSAVPLNRAGSRSELGLIRRLSDRLADLDRPVSARGILAVQKLLTDGIASPLYVRERVSELRPALERCLAELDAAPTAPALHARRNGSAGKPAVARVAMSLGTLRPH